MLAHEGDVIFERHAIRPPVQPGFGLGGIADQLDDLVRTQSARIQFDMILPAQIEMTKRGVEKLLSMEALAAADDERLRPLLLEHSPHHLTPEVRPVLVAVEIEITEGDLLLSPQRNACGRLGHTADKKGLVT